LYTDNENIPGAAVKLNVLIKLSTYVDDVIAGRFSVKEAVSLYTTLKSLFTKASLNLRKFLSNSEDMMSKIPKIDQATEDSLNIGSSQKNVGY